MAYMTRKTAGDKEPTADGKESDLKDRRVPHELCDRRLSSSSTVSFVSQLAPTEFDDYEAASTLLYMSGATPSPYPSPTPALSPSCASSPASGSDYHSADEYQPISVSVRSSLAKTKAAASSKKKIMVKVQPKAKVRSSGTKSATTPKNRTPLPRPAPKLNFDGLTKAEVEEVLSRTLRDQRKALAIVRFRNDPAFEAVTPPCDRCAASGWECFKRLPEVVDSTRGKKPGPARGWGRGCVSCHKSACSFASEPYDSEAVPSRRAVGPKRG